MKKQIWAVRLDETDRYPAEWRAERGISRMCGIYAYDASKAVHCCEMTPSYELFYAGCYWEGDEREGDALEALDTELREADADTPDIQYVHCASIDRIPEGTLGYLPDGLDQLREMMKEVDDDIDSDDAVEGVVEHLRCNGYTI